MKVLDLFSGIGGFALGLERAGGFETVAFCENDRACKKVLNKHWPMTPIFHNVENLTYENGVLMDRVTGDHLRTEIHCLTGGFPCVDISVGGKKKGLYDKKLFQKCIDDGMNEDDAKRYAKTRSGLWFEYARLIKEIKPRWVIIENVDRLIESGLKEVLDDLAKIRYDAEWGIITAEHIGGPHKRARCWIVAYTSQFRSDVSVGEERSIQDHQERNNQKVEQERQCQLVTRPHGQIFSERFMQIIHRSRTSKWSSESSVCPLVDGLSQEVELERRESIKQLGNAVVPLIPELLGKAIMNVSSGRPAWENL